jgi:hypothetical protein
MIITALALTGAAVIVGGGAYGTYKVIGKIREHGRSNGSFRSTKSM